MNPSSLPASNPGLGPVRFGLRFKVLAGLTAFNIAVTLLFTVNHYVLEKEHIMVNLRQRLAGYAASLPDLVPEGYLDRATAPDAIPAAEYRRVVDRLNHYCAAVGLRFLYTYTKGEKGFYCTATNCPPEEKFTPYWEFYDTAPAEIAAAWDTDKPVYAIVNDKWGRTFTLFAPMRTAGGVRYLAGADLPISFVDELLNQSLRQSLYVGAGSFVFFFVVSAYVSTRFSRQITKLAAYTRELAKADFRPDADTPIRREIIAIPAQRRDEVGELAHSFIVMEDQLGTYLHRLQAETAAKERAQNELRIAGEIQVSMLPHTFPISDGLDLHAAMKPAKEAGGDYYDFFFLDPDHLCFSIGDVSDKGMPAALFMGVALTTLRAKATPDLVNAPEEILRQTNELLILQNQACQFVTMFLGVLNVRTGVVTYSDGGHNRPYHRTHDGVAHMLSIPPREGIALGVMPGAAFKQHTLQLKPGEALFLYTDGVTEAVAANESFYREPRLEQVLASLPASTPASGWVESVMNDVFEFSRGHVQADDITMLVVRMKN
jgi:phosphoserine phosphatase RsbU/P